jgi:thymidylate synthase (FAD)
MQGEIAQYFEQGQRLYNNLLNQGVAKECARFVLPLSTQTRIYMTGSCRSWIHYINLRSSHGTQQEHKKIAEECRCVFMCQFPDVADALEWARTPDCPECFDAPSITLE